MPFPRKLMKIYRILLLVAMWVAIYVFISLRSKNRYSVQMAVTFNQSKHTRFLDFKDKVQAAAKKITKNGDILLVSFIQNTSLAFAYSWFCNVQSMNLYKQTLVIAADQETERVMNMKRPDITTVLVGGPFMQGNQKYTHTVRSGIKRTQILNWILEENIGIFVFEFDCLWVRNPIHELSKFSEHDLVIRPVSQNSKTLDIGVYYMAPTDRMKQLWQELTRRLMIIDDELTTGTESSDRDNFQFYLNALINAKYANVRVKLLSFTDFPDGKWYELPEHERNLSNIFIIQNNGIEGNTNKIKRAQEFGHWFLKDDDTCDTEKVDKIVQN